MRRSTTKAAGAATLSTLADNKNIPGCGGGSPGGWGGGFNANDAVMWCQRKISRQITDQL